jgi:hypothetical protein
MWKGGKKRTAFPLPSKMSPSTRASSALTASLFGSILSALWRSASNESAPNIPKQNLRRPRTIVGLAKFVESSPGLRSAKECFHILVGQAEHGRTVTFSVFTPGSVHLSGGNK